MMKEEHKHLEMQTYPNMYDRERPRCLLSHPAHPHHNLSLRVSYAIPLGCFTCGQKYTMFAEEYHCTTCRVEFHDGCHQRPRMLTHPYHLQHPLTLFYRGPETGTSSNVVHHTVLSKSDIVFDKCTWCGKDFQGDWFYRYLICSFCLDLPCATTLPPLTIANPKGHHYSLLFLPRPLLVPCDACGLVEALEPSYACFQCNYMVHQKCIDLPRVIKITRHPHRLSYIPYRSPLISSCRICYKDVDVKYGQYSCIECPYVAHSKCATHKNVWDGMELEWETEECVSVQECFIHKSHDPHHLFVSTFYNNKVETLCRGCKRRCVTSHLQCRECEFALCYKCGTIPDEIHYRFDKHPLTLSYGGESAEEEMYWCEVCEKQLEQREWYYTCNECCITVHLECVSGGQ
ncbi:hypothetical protein Bca101_062766 [Brassica carinata]